MYSFLLVLHCVVTLLLVVLVLVQKSDGAGMALGGQVSGMMTPRGAANLLTRMTAVLATLFMVNCLLLSWVAVRSKQNRSVLAAESVVHESLTCG